jgi:hypothetical protein
MRSVQMVLGAIVIILLMGATLAAINLFRMEDYTATYNNVITAPGVTTGNTTLTQPLYDEDVALVSVSSNDTNDAPIPTTYTKATRRVDYIGLTESTTRSLTVTYSIDRLRNYLGASIASSTWPIFLILGVIGIIAGAVVWAVKKD